MIACDDYWSKFAKELVQLTNLKHNGIILDVGTGPGECLLAARNELDEYKLLIGIDQNIDQITKAKKIFKDLSIKNAKFQIMNANNLKFDNDYFDNILSGFIGFSDAFDFANNRFIGKNAKMKEIYRTLKPRGEAAFSTWAYQQDIEIARSLLQRYLIDKKVMTLEKINNLHISYSKETVTGFRLLMEDARFKEIKIISKDFQICYNTSEEWWDVMKKAAWIMIYSLNHDLAKLKDLKNYILPEGIESFKTKRGYIFQKKVIFGIGSK